jgi:cytochrome c-type biogenesis protein CcmE
MTKRTWLATVGLTLAMAGLLGTGTAVAATPPGGGARSGPADGGATGIVQTVSTSGITLTTATGVEVTADEDAATKYKVGSLPATVHAVRTGESVLVLGLVDNSTIAATEVVVQPGGDGGVKQAARVGVIQFQQGVSSPTKSVGQVPSDYTEGDGTIVSGTVADKATAAAQAVVPGGIVDRVVRLSDGEYEVHNISVNWPHHVFVSSDFTVLGYE